MITEHSENLILRQVEYEDMLELSDRKDFGIFLTHNINTIDNILSIVNFQLPVVLKMKVLEPSCGNGVFIIRYLEELINLGTNEYELANYIENNLFYNDIDDKMINITTDNIKTLYQNHYQTSYRGKFNSFVFDFTQRIKSKGNSLFDTLLDVPLTQYIDKIDYIIGNPPYVSLYGRRDRKKNENQRIYYLNRYSQFPATLKNGKINYVMLFIEQSIDFLKTGGKLSFIIDLAFFETAYQHTRKYLLENARILSIEYNIKDFEVASGQVILKIQKEKVKSNMVTIIDAESKKKIKIDQFSWNNPTDQYRYRFNLCSDNEKIIEKIEKKGCRTLKAIYPKKNLRTCVMLLNMEDLFVFKKQQENWNVPIYPYYQGSKSLSEKYGKLKNTVYFHYNKELQDEINEEIKVELTGKGIKNKKRLGLGETIIYDNPKIFIRQSAKEILATYDPNPSSANNSLYVFSLRENNEKSKRFLKFLTGFLNSNLITFYAQQKKIIRFSQGKQPQIKTSDLYTIPIPDDVELQSKIANLVNEIYQQKDDISIISKEIDNIIFDYFNFNQDEVEKIIASIESF